MACFRRSVKFASFILLTTLVAAGAVLAETAVIVHPKNPEKSMLAAQAAQIFLGKSTRLTPLDLADNSPLRAEFYQKIAGKDQDQVKAIWSKVVFSGKGLPPREYNSSAEVRQAVAADPGMIGYIDKAAVDDTVHVVLIVR